MSDERWNDLMTMDGTLSAEEIADGWHWCPEFDGMLIGPGMDEIVVCQCEVYA